MFQRNCAGARRSVLTFAGEPGGDGASSVRAVLGTLCDLVVDTRGQGG